MNGEFYYVRKYKDTRTRPRERARNVRVNEIRQYFEQKKLNEINMKNSMFFLLTVVVLGSCSRSEMKPDDINTYIDDSLFMFHIPVSMLNFSNMGAKSDDIYEYEYSDKIGSNSKIIVSHTWGLYVIKNPETIMEDVLKKELWIIKFFDAITFVAYDTVRVDGQKMVIIRKTDGCGDSALFITNCFIASPLNNRIYRVSIQCDKSQIGYMLRDSVPKIINSFSFGSTKTKKYKLNTWSSQ